MFVALGIQPAKRMRRVILSSVVWQAVQYFSTLSHKRNDFRGGELFNTKCIFLFSLQSLSETFLILRGIQRDITINVLRTLCRARFILAIFQWNYSFLDRFSKIP